MAFPAEFSYSSEDGFIQRFMIPLLNRLGFSVVNYHGVQEFGRDLIFAEFDRFGHVRYHGLQAKYVASIGKRDSHGLVQDCHEAFFNPFKHPQTGASERISSFYAVNGGDISQPASDHFFNSLIQYGANVRLLDGKALVALDRWAAFNRGAAIGETLTGLIIEIRNNRCCMPRILELWQLYIKEETNPLPFTTLRGIAASNYLARPIAPSNIDVQTVLRYCSYVEQVREVTHFCTMSLGSIENKRNLISELIDNATNFYLRGNEIEQQATAVLASLGPITGL